ncbi:MAG: hypothetical protein Q8N51_09565, partial [Gammaproteobacteria bacterium]|nr:hypothetical protein [Gammaproteobacteria bacterium]
NVVWRGTESILDLILTKRGKEREAAVAVYIDGAKKGDSNPCAKPDGAKLNEGLSKLRTWSFRLMTDICTNESQVLRNIRDMRDSGVTAELQMAKFREFVACRYGDTFAALSHCLTKAKESKPGIDAIDGILKKAGEMNDTELQLLVSKLQALYSERVASLAEMQEMLAPETAPAETAPAAELEAVAA